jgi:hypothetical protein
MDWEKLSEEVKEWLKHTVNELGVSVAAATKNVFSIAETKIPREIWQWIEGNPGQTAFIVASGPVFFAPFLIEIPVLTSLGFGTEGVIAGNYLPGNNCIE